MYSGVMRGCSVGVPKGKYVLDIPPLVGCDAQSTVSIVGRVAVTREPVHELGLCSVAASCQCWKGFTPTCRRDKWTYPFGAAVDERGEVLIQEVGQAASVLHSDLVRRSLRTQGWTLVIALFKIALDAGDERRCVPR